MQEVREQELQLLLGKEGVKPLSLLQAKVENSFSTFRLSHLGQDMVVDFFNTSFSNLFPHERQLYSNIGIISPLPSLSGERSSLFCYPTSLRRHPSTVDSISDLPRLGCSPPSPHFRVGADA